MIRGILAVAAFVCFMDVACGQDAPPPDILSAIVRKLESKPAPTGIVFRPAATESAPDNSCPLRPFDMQLTRNDRPVRTYSVMLDAQSDPSHPQPKQFLAVVTRMQVDVDGSGRAYHPDDPEGERTCTRVTGPDGHERPVGICALDKFSSGRILLFRGADRLSKDDLVREWKDMWPLVRDRGLKPVDLRDSYGPDAPAGYYFFHWRPRNLTVFFKRFIVPQSRDGYPCVHGAESRYPGYFVAATTLNHNAPARADGCAPARYIDAEEVPFLVLPKGGFGGVEIGDVMVARIKRDGFERTVYGIVADAGPAHQLGEGSAALNAALLGRAGQPLMNMRDSWALDIEGPPVAMLVLGGTRERFKGDYSRKNVEAVARAEFARWGGSQPLARFDACVARAKINRKCDALRDKC
jgi:hypothetical protein